MPLVQQRSVGPLVHLDSAIVRLAAHEGLALAFPTPSATLARRVPQTITEIITTDVAPSTTVSSPAQSTTSIPVSAIAGGAVAGAVVAVLLAILWKMYSRCSRRNRENYRMRFVSISMICKKLKLVITLIFLPGRRCGDPRRHTKTFK